MKKLAGISFLFIFVSIAVKAQQTQHTAWFSYQFSKKIKSKISADFNLRLRTADDYQYLKTYILRPSISYLFHKNIAVALGFQYFNHTQKPIGLAKYQLEEGGIWEQLFTRIKLKNSNLSLRLRLEQRFIEQTAGNVFTQRVRIQARLIKPLNQKDSVFNKGLYLTLQDEVFFNVQNKKYLNNRLLDQNRLAAGFGYRLNNAVDIEGSYAHFAILGKTDYNYNKVMQLSLITRF